ncbi:hypothetical protein MKR81_07055 [Vibrio campbellii]|uniref:hypothetical protein n=1 Tax=Vibrio campbellii TaxID=680 RepID=UPI001F079C58|nr:hypothetical protein [Vibrio campbellii]UMM04344.1 hypothetical protein MKR81_07055 [Vibrio campbellii]
MKQIVKCTKCGADAEGFGTVSCWCDKDHCLGQRCAAGDLSASFKCSHCGSEGTPAETTRYRERHANK